MKLDEKPLRLLFVDDDSDEFYLFNEALEHSGLEFILSRAKDGNDLMEHLRAYPLPYMVFIDLNMPYEDGMEALAEIRNNPAYDQLPLVIYSTSKNPNFIDQCYQKGANLFVVKPNSFDGMVEVVKSVCTIDWAEFKHPTRENFVLMLDVVE